MAEYPRKKLRKLQGHRGAALVAKFNAPGTYCMTGGQDKMVRLWNPHKERSEAGTNLVHEYHGHNYEVRDISILHDNTQFASCGGDRAVFVWDVVTSRIKVKLRHHESRVNAVAYNEEGNVLASGGYDRKVCLWDMMARSRDPIQTMADSKDSVTTVLVHGHEIICGSVDGTVLTYDIRMGRVHIDHLHSGVTALRMSGDGNCLLAGCMDSTVKLLDRSTGELLNTYQGHRSSDYRVGCAMSSDDAFVLAGSEGGEVFVWDLVDCSVAHKLRGHGVVVCDVAYHPKDSMAISAAVDGSVIVWK